MNLERIPALTPDGMNVVIETPKGARQKYVYDPETGTFRLKKILPLGFAFPFDFGFIPNTKGEDGDPLDVLVLMDEPAYPGCLVECRIAGVLEAMQKENHEKIRNDRIIGVASVSQLFSGIKQLDAIRKKQIETFFIGYNRQEGKEFIPGKWEDAKKALALISRQVTTTQNNSL
jgi:inorganic pyrophosphatase